jgi:hypothetical protein
VLLRSLSMGSAKLINMLILISFVALGESFGALFVKICFDFRMFFDVYLTFMFNTLVF